MRAHAGTVWIVVGAIIGGAITGPFRLQPPWLWGMLGGLAGGLLGSLAAYVSTRRWHWSLRALTIALVLGSGFFGLWMVTSLQFVLEWVAGPTRR